MPRRLGRSWVTLRFLTSQQQTKYSFANSARKGPATMSSVKRLAAAAASLAFSAILLWAQAQTGSISGSVTDVNKAAIAGAAVEAKSPATGVTLRTVSSEAGDYVFPNVATGIWTITAEKPGFKRL